MVSGAIKSGADPILRLTHLRVGGATSGHAVHDGKDASLGCPLIRCTVVGIHHVHHEVRSPCYAGLSIPTPINSHKLHYRVTFESSLSLHCRDELVVLL